MSAPRNRRTAGTPTGGQFAPTQLTESDLVLDAESDSPAAVASPPAPVDRMARHARFIADVKSGAVGRDGVTREQNARFAPDVRGWDVGRSAAVEGWYHGSPHEIEVGDYIEPGHAAANFAESDTASVSITSEPETATSWMRKIGGRYLYEVELAAPTVAHRAMPKNYGDDTRFDEARTERVRVVRRIEIPAD